VNEISPLLSGNTLSDANICLFMWPVGKATWFEEGRICCHWQRFADDIYPAEEIIFVSYYNRNETETVVADQLKQAVTGYYPSRINEITYIFFDYIN
jgi:hypothetical protein